jgi:hypothetical protein
MKNVCGLLACGGTSTGVPIKRNQNLVLRSFHVAPQELLAQRATVDRRKAHLADG